MHTFLRIENMILLPFFVLDPAKMSSTTNNELGYNQATVDAVRKRLAGNEARAKVFEDFLDHAKSPQGVMEHKKWLELVHNHDPDEDSDDWAPPPNKVPSPTSERYGSTPNPKMHTFLRIEKYDCYSCSLCPSSMVTVSNVLPSPTHIDNSTRRHSINVPFKTKETKTDQDCDSAADTVVLEDPDDKPPSPTYSEGYTSDAWMADNLETSRLEAEEYRKELEAKGEKDTDLTVAEIRSRVASIMAKGAEVKARAEEAKAEEAKAEFRDAKEEAHLRSRSTYDYWACGYQVGGRTQPPKGELVDMKYMKVKPYNYYEAHPEAVPKITPPTWKCTSLSLCLSLSLLSPLSLSV